MPQPLPPPSRRSYMDLTAVKNAIQEVERTPFGITNLNIVSGVLNAILNWKFPVSDGYIIRAMDHMEMQRAEQERVIIHPPSTDLHVLRYISAVDTRARKFLVVLCKPNDPSDKLDGLWEGEIGVHDFWYHDENSNDALLVRKTYFIVAIGNWLRVYECDTVNRVFRGFSVSELPLHLARDRETVEDILDYIRRNNSSSYRSRHDHSPRNSCIINQFSFQMSIVGSQISLSR